MEQSFSKASRCFHDGRFGPKAEDTERRCMTVLCMTDKDDQKAIVFGARTLFASAVKKHKGKQASPRLDKGIARKTKPTSERTWLQNKKQSLQKVTAALPATEGNTEQELSAKGSKEITLQKKRRFDRAIDAAQRAISWQRMKGLSPLTKLQPKKGNWSSKMPKESTKWRPAICIGKTFPSNRHGTGSLWVLKKHGQQPRFRKACVGLLFSWRRVFFSLP